MFFSFVYIFLFARFYLINFDQITKILYQITKVQLKLDEEKGCISKSYYTTNQTFLTRPSLAKPRSSNWK